MGVWFVYLLECADGSLYCGSTTDPQRRLAQHNGLIPGGARYTRTRRPVRLMAFRLCPDQGAALRLELQIKARPKAQKIRFLLSGGSACFPLT
ncbi:MAG: GIY-YIG nuclease family protein [Desulfovibrio sp.]|nr:GIY-YIG nuclease family protein [Desulfovibrio sp.]